MSLTILRLLTSAIFLGGLKADVRDHRQFQYNSQVDQGGNYNFAYDTGSRTSDAHTMHQEYRDSSGIVRGRYGYTDPRGKLRMVEYEAGPDGYKARGDVGPDLFPHMEAPGLAPLKPHPAPSPLQLSGWDPVKNPINSPILETEVESQGQVQKSYSDSARYRANRRSSQLSRLQERYGSNAYDATPKYVSKTYNGQNYLCRTYDDDVTPKYVCRAYDATPKYSVSRDYYDKSRYFSRSYDTTPSYVIKTYNGQKYVCRTYIDDVTPRYVCRIDDATPKYMSRRDYHNHDTPKYVSKAYQDHDAEKYVSRAYHDHDAEKYVNKAYHDHDAERYVRRIYHALPKYTRQGRSLEPPITQEQQRTISNIDVNPDDIRMAAPPVS